MDTRRGPDKYFFTQRRARETRFDLLLFFCAASCCGTVFSSHNRGDFRPTGTTAGPQFFVNGLHDGR